MKIRLYQKNKINSLFKCSDKISNKIIGYWLLTCSSMVFVAVTLGMIF
jgi:hypothetical protein